MAKQKINKNKIIREWLRANGACYFDLRHQDIIFPDGGIWSIRKKIVKRHKVLGFEPTRQDGVSKVIFSKKKYDTEEYEGSFWICELDEIIEYFQSMRKMLKKIGYETRPLRKINRKKRKKRIKGKSQKNKW